MNSDTGKSLRKGCGCIRGLFSGCVMMLVVVIGLIVVIDIISEIDLPFGRIDKTFTIPAKNSAKLDELINVSYTWKYVDNNLDRRKTTLNMQLLGQQIQEAAEYIHRVSKMNIDELGLDESLVEADSITFARELWKGIYRKVYKQSYSQIDDIAKGLTKIFNEEKMSASDRILFLTTFVQNIEYKLPESALGFLPPVICLRDKFGDCDTKALLLYVLLERMNVDCVMFWSLYYHHAMIGINTNAAGLYKVHQGRRYYFLETTYPGWDIGVLPPEVDNIDYWYLDDLG